MFYIMCFRGVWSLSLSDELIIQVLSRYYELILSVNYVVIIYQHHNISSVIMHKLDDIRKKNLRELVDR